MPDEHFITNPHQAAWLFSQLPIFFTASPTHSDIIGTLYSLLSRRWPVSFFSLGRIIGMSLIVS